MNFLDDLLILYAPLAIVVLAIAGLFWFGARGKIPLFEEEKGA
ncbi:cytochrome bd oxidase small subunit CydS [Brevibacillus parabrevis]|nr:hypothetical protein [Brevibacillus parabrevis]